MSYLSVFIDGECPFRDGDLVRWVRYRGDRMTNDASLKWLKHGMLGRIIFIRNKKVDRIAAYGTCIYASIGWQNYQTLHSEPRMVLGRFYYPWDSLDIIRPSEPFSLEVEEAA